MSKPLEVAGAVLAFIPIVSTVTGLIQAYIYYNKTHPKNTETEKQQLAMNDMAKKTENIVETAFPSYKEQKEACYNKLFVACLIEAIPIANFGAAIYHSIVLSDLYKLKKNKETIPPPKFKKMSEDLKSLSSQIFGPQLRGEQFDLDKFVLQKNEELDFLISDPPCLLQLLPEIPEVLIDPLMKKIYEKGGKTSFVKDLNTFIRAWTEKVNDPNSLTTEELQSLHSLQLNLEKTIRHLEKQEHELLYNKMMDQLYSKMEFTQGSRDKLRFIWMKFGDKDQFIEQLQNYIVQQFPSINSENLKINLHSILDVLEQKGELAILDQINKLRPAGKNLSEVINEKL